MPVHPIPFTPVKYSNAFHEHFKMFKEAQEAGLSFIYRQLYQRYYTTALYMVKEDVAAGCIAQEAFLRLWQRRKTINDLPHLTAFLYKQTKQAARDYYQQSSTRFYRSLIRLDGMENAYEYFVSCDTFSYEVGSIHNVDPSLEHERKAQKQQLLSVLPRLPESQRQVVNLLLRYEFDYERIAWHLGGVSCYVAAKRIEQTLALLKSILVGGTSLSKEQIAKKPVVLSGGLSAEQADILRYRYELSYSFEEIARLMNVRQAEVQLQFVRAQQALRKEKAA
jgi:RNA polymerase sigma factor (sigma-70 family)